MENLLTEAQVADLVTSAVEKAIKAVNTPDVESRPSAPMVNLNRPHRASTFKAIKAAKTGNWSGAEFERDLSQATRELLMKGESPETSTSFFIPSSHAALADVLDAISAKTEGYPALRAGIIEGTVASGGALVPPQYLQNEFVLALSTGVALRNTPGVDVVPVNSNIVYLPRESVRAATAQVAEQGTLNSADPTFAQQSFTIRKRYAYRTASNELLADSLPSAEAYLMRTLARDIALAEDLDLLEGNGTAPNSTGLGSYSGLTTGYTASTAAGDSYSTATAFGKLMDIVYALRIAGVEPTAWIMHPRTMQSLEKVQDSTGRYILGSVGGNFGAPTNAMAGTSFDYPGPIRGMLLGYPVLFSAQIPINETTGSNSATSHLYLGNWTFAKVLERQAIEIAVSEHIAFNSDQTALRAIQRSTVALTQPAAFVKQGGIAV